MVTSTAVNLSPSTVAVPVSVLKPPSCLPPGLVPTQVIFVLSPLSVTFFSSAKIEPARTATATAANKLRISASPKRVEVEARLVYRQILGSRRGRQVYGRNKEVF